MQFMGQDIEQMSKAELIDAVRQLGQLLELERAMHRETLEAWTSAQKGREWLRNSRH